MLYNNFARRKLMGSRPSKPVFWISLIVGAYAIIDHFFLKLNLPVISEVPNFVLLTFAFVLIMLGIIFKGL
ncbi:MAG: hypothetical protein GX090_02615 [Firmicutes bacterium]|nr:hypothetical protein [Bacillota bacterium]